MLGPILDAVGLECKINIKFFASKEKKDKFRMSPRYNIWDSCVGAVGNICAVEHMELMCALRKKRGI